MFVTMRPELKAVVEKYTQNTNINTDALLDELISKIKKNM